MNISELLTEVLSIGEGGKSFYHIANSDRKVWLMPVDNLRTAMNLYQPSGRNGKLLKRWFPLLHRLPLLRRKLHIETTWCSLADDLYDKLCKLFMVDRLEFAVFCGTPCVHQKLTIQISIGKRILGYCKVSDHREVISLFSREGGLLKELEHLGRDSVPRILFVGEWRSGIHLLVQTTTKMSHSQVIHEWGMLHEEFLEKLFAKTKRLLPFEETDYCRTLSELREHIDWLPSEEARALLGNAMDKVFIENKGQMVEYGVYHADFTPWNMFVEQGKLFVFDWEYAKMTYPPYLDYFHFFTQTAIFEKHLDADGIWKLFQQHKKDIDTLLSSNQMDFAYLCYLLGNITHYIKRENGIYSKSMIDYFKVYIYLMQQLLSQNI